ncbi:GNAT family N-acetyltransferase [Agromyces salentinus]|uniref:N-acetyltransferase domain-containing protein n=1 Tax=Agromyces salentinus TaxID=269421 RepID=A0ABN2MPJ3_9MICO|nr:GNAT family N-acetyltransferase [Agromyces salentinus]
MNDEYLTERLLLTPLTPDDLEDVHRVYGDERTWRHLPSGRHLDRGISMATIERSSKSRREHGFGMNAVRLREPVGDLAPGTFAGVAGASMMAFGAWNLSYRFAPDAWGHGLAVEAARRSLAAAIEGAPAAPVTARVLANNPASIRVLERLGLELAWRGASSAEPTHDGDTTHLERLVFSDRALDEPVLDAVIALG